VNLCARSTPATALADYPNWWKSGKLFGEGPEMPLTQEHVFDPRLSIPDVPISRPVLQLGHFLRVSSQAWPKS
jgi:hypothetical protein